MALFGKKKQSADAANVADAPQSSAHSQKAAVHAGRDVSAVLRAPHITEKAFGQSQRGVYTFVVDPHATKRDVKEAVATVYNVTPVRVNIVKKRPRMVRSMMRKHPRHQAGLKKAYVYLKDGDTISFI
jgi:large subunit ribosomal protein L23